MHTTNAILDAAKAHQGIATDYALSKALEVYPSAVKNYRSGRSFPDDVVAERLAVLANLDRGYTVACIHAQRAGETSQEGLWHYVASMLSNGGRPHSINLAIISAVILSALFGFDGGPDAGAALLSSVAITAENAGIGLYIM